MVLALQDNRNLHHGGSVGRCDERLIERGCPGGSPPGSCMKQLLGVRTIRAGLSCAPAYTILSCSLVVLGRAAQFVLVLCISRFVAEATAGQPGFAAQSGNLTLIFIILLVLGIPVIDALGDACIYQVQYRSQFLLQPRALAAGLPLGNTDLASKSANWVGQEGVSLVAFVLQQRLAGLASLAVLCTWNMPLGLLVGIAVWYSGHLATQYAATMQQELASSADELAKRSQFYWRAITSPEFAGELRMFRLGEVMASRFASVSRMRLATVQARSRNYFNHSVRATLPFLAAFLTYMAWNLFDPAVDNAAFLAAVVVSFAGLAGLGGAGSVQVHAVEFESMLAELNDVPAVRSRHESRANSSSSASVNYAPAFRNRHELGQTSSNGAVNECGVQDRSPILVVSDVVFGFDEEPVLQGVSVALMPGERLAIVGENGAGKSTLVKLITGQLAPASGTVSLDGNQPRTILASGQGIPGLGLVAQDFMQLPLPPMEQVTVGRTITPAVVKTVADELGITGLFSADKSGDVSTKSQSSIVSDASSPGPGQGGFSRGQWQKLAIARALVTPAAGSGRLLVLDEPASALDIESEHALYSQVINHAHPLDSLIVVTHRLSSIIDVDRIVVLADGQIVEEGTHDELMALGGHYRRMFDAQQQSLKLQTVPSDEENEERATPPHSAQGSRKLGTEERAGTTPLVESSGGNDVSPHAEACSENGCESLSGDQ